MTITPYHKSLYYENDRVEVTVIRFYSQEMVYEASKEIRFTTESLHLGTTYQMCCKYSVFGYLQKVARKTSF